MKKTSQHLARLIAGSLLAFILDKDLCAEEVKVRAPYFGIHIVDEDTGRGIPLVEIRTVNDVKHVTDNAGWIAFHEPGMMDRDVFWHVSGPGIEAKADGFGFRCLRAKTVTGSSVTMKVRNTNIATRLCRLTGQGLYRDSELLGLPAPIPSVMEPGVTGQDSVQAVPYGDKIFWLWGDTNLMRYQLGNYNTTVAFTPRDAHPESGLRFEYLLDSEKPEFLRKMMPSEEHGAVWLFGLMTLSDESGKERVFSGFSRQRGLVPPDERGIAEYDPKLGRFRKVADIEKEEKHRFPSGHAVRVKTGEGDHFYFTASFANTRVKADEKSIADPGAYELLRFDKAKQAWAWQKNEPPTMPADEKAMIKSGDMRNDQALYQIADAATGKALSIHGASIQWNEWRKKFVLIGVQFGGKDDPSMLGEVWYAEAPKVTGPWRKAVKVVSHPRYSYYNPVHHGFLNREGGRVIYFEGTYTLEFSGNPIGTIRYDYNQLMYRLDLDDEKLKPAQQP
jgi:hypothetical protein